MQKNTMQQLVFVIIILNLFATEAVNIHSSIDQTTVNQSVNKRKFIIFSGSDWCKNCIRFKSEVLSSDVFTSFAKDHVDIITADFPQKTKLPKQEVMKNEALAEKYNPEGEFPRLVLLSEDESNSKVIRYTNQTPEEFVAELKANMAR